ncbi:hypothetical protein [Photobacterium leiognathi]|nr:hypothetical protein [Photobacterium leiognathi]
MLKQFLHNVFHKRQINKSQQLRTRLEFVIQQNLGQREARYNREQRYSID